MELFFLLLSVDLRKITCKPYFWEWDCWYNQTCGDTLYQCNDAPPFSALAFGWIVRGCIGLIVLFVFCVLKKKICCR